MATPLGEHGYRLEPVALPPAIRERVRARDWAGLDAEIRRETLAGGVIFEALRRFDEEFEEIEFILALRPSSPEEPDEDGIWHDDGSRRIAFSLSLTLEPAAIEGGRLGLRRRGAGDDAIAWVPTPEFGTMIVFATGRSGFEHRIHRVERGERLIAAGWCT